MKTRSLLLAFAILTCFPVRVVNGQSIISVARLNEKSRLSVAKFKTTSTLSDELEKQQRRLDYRDATVLTIENVSGLSVVVPIRNSKTGELTGSYYLYTNFEKKGERGVVLDGRKGEILIREPGTNANLRLLFDDKGNLIKAERVGDSKFWDCCSKTIQDSVLIKSFAGAMCAGCVATGFGVPACIGCGVLVAGPVAYSIYTCTD